MVTCEVPSEPVPVARRYRCESLGCRALPGRPWHLDVLHRHLTRGGIDDEIVADAVCLRLASAIECLAATSPELRERAFGEQWAAIWATRNRIAHGYAYIDMAMIQATVRHDLPPFEDALRFAHAASEE